MALAYQPRRAFTRQNRPSETEALVGRSYRVREQWYDWVELGMHAHISYKLVNTGWRDKREETFAV